MAENESEGMYQLALPIAILVAAVLVSGTMLYAASSVSTNIYALKGTLSTLSLQGGTVPTGGTTPTGGTGGTGGTTPTGGTGGTAINYDISNRAFRGTANAPITIVMFSDFQCPYCSRVEPTITQLLADYPGKIKVVFLNYPLPFHDNAQKAAEAAECAADQNKFWEMHDKMFENQNALAVSDLKGYAAGLGLNTATFNQCLDSGAKAAAVTAQTDAGSAAGVEGTPTFFINGQILVGAQPIAKFKQIIDAQLAG